MLQITDLCSANNLTQSEMSEIFGGWSIFDLPGDDTTVVTSWNVEPPTASTAGNQLPMTVSEEIQFRGKKIGTEFFKGFGAGSRKGKA